MILAGPIRVLVGASGIGPFGWDFGAALAMSRGRSAFPANFRLPSQPSHWRQNAPRGGTLSSDPADQMIIGAVPSPGRFQPSVQESTVAAIRYRKIADELRSAMASSGLVTYSPSNTN